MDRNHQQIHDFSIVVAQTAEDFKTGAKLFREYAATLQVDLAFQDFEKEIASISLQYNQPGGALLLLKINNQVVGCAGIRELDPQVAELKRMYVRAEYRQHKLGRHLLDHALELAKSLGYGKIRLDTLPDMVQAQNLYRSYHFYEIPPYRFNPVAGTVYMEKLLE